MDYIKYLIEQAESQKPPRIIETPTINDCYSFQHINDSFDVKSYRLVIRQSVDLVNASQVENQSYCEHNKGYRHKGELHTCFCPIYLMTCTYEHERYCFYYGKTNSSQKRFRNHHAKEKFLDMTNLSDRKLHMAQVFVTFTFQGNTYNDIPLEWITFSIDDDKELRLSTIKQLEVCIGEKISKLEEINKIILFIENFLITFNTSLNARVEIPRSLFNIYTKSIEINENNGEIFYCNLSCHPHDDKDGFQEDVCFDDMDNYYRENGCCKEIETDSQESEGDEDQSINDYEYWLKRLKGVTNPENEEELWLD